METSKSGLGIPPPTHRSLASINESSAACPLCLPLNGGLLCGFDLLLQETRGHGFF